MGITNLLPFLRKHAPEAMIQAPSLNTLKDKKVAIDLAIFMRKIFYDTQEECCQLLLDMNQKLKGHGIHPVWVFDGTDSALDKMEEREDRQKKRKRGQELADEYSTLLAKEKELITTGDGVKKAKTEMDAAKEALIVSPTPESRIAYDKSVIVHQRVLAINDSMVAKMQRLTEIDAIQKKQESVVSIDYAIIKQAFLCGDVTFVMAKGEAERCCAWLAQTQQVDMVASDDSDAFAHASPKILRNLGFGFDTSQQKMELWDFAMILQKLKLSYPSFVEFCLLCGCDFCDNIQGLGPAAAYKLIHYYETIDKAVTSPLFVKWKQAENFASVQERWDRARKRLYLTKEMDKEIIS